MKIIAIFLFFSISIFGQNSIFSGQIKFREDNSPVPQAILKLTKEDVSIGTVITDINGVFKFNNLSNGEYLLNIESIGYRPMSLKVILSGDVNQEILFPAPCQASIKKCPKNHIDHIIPIVYGLPDKKTLKKAKKEKIYLGGCIITGCDPKWYCTVHKEEF